MNKRKFQNWMEYIAFRGLICFLKLFPYRVIKGIVLGMFYLVGYQIGIRREVAFKQLSKVFPHKTKAEKNRIIWNMYKNMALTICESYLMSDDKLIEACSICGQDIIDEAFAKGKGVILATCHFGNWEAARVFPHFNIPVSVITKRQRNDLFDAYTNRIRERLGVSVIDMYKGLREINTRLKNNEMIAILTDQYAGGRGIISDFLGFPATHWKGAAKLSLKLKVPIVVGYALRNEDERIVFTFDSMIYHDCWDDTEENIRAVIDEVNRIHEQYIIAHPHQWFWVHKRWKGTGQQGMK